MLVIFIHVSSQAVTGLEKGSAAYGLVFTLWKLSAFAVQGFLFISGIKMILSIKAKEKFSYPKYLWGRFKSIVVPYLLWVLIYYIYFCSIGYFPFKASDFIGYVIRGDLVAHFYFVITIVQFYLLAPLWIKAAEKANACAAIVFGLFVTLLLGQWLPFAYNDRVFTTYIFYWIIGIFAGTDYEKFIETLKKNRAFILIVFVISGSADVYFSMNGWYGFNETLHVLYCVSAIMSMYIIAIALCKVLPKFFESKFFSTLNSSTYYVYLSHCLLIFILNDKLPKAGISSIKGQLISKAIIVYTVTISLSMFYVVLKKYVKKLLTRDKQKSIIQ